MTESKTRTHDRKQTTDGNVSKTEETEEHVEENTCPECSGNLSIAQDSGELVCESCGLVIEEQNIDRGPEWRAFNSEDRQEKSRVGAPTTKMMHDDGLSTNISWQNKDAQGRSLSSRQRKKMERLRTWNERFRTQNSRERNLKQALGEIDRMASALGLPQNVRETASVIYRRALEDDLLPGRSIEGVATGALYAAARDSGHPRSMDEVGAVTRVDQQEFQRAYIHLQRELNLEIEPTRPEQYIPRLVSDLGDEMGEELSSDNEREIENTARDLLETAREHNLHSGKSPVAMAAAAIYAAGLLTRNEATQTTVAEVSNMSEVTIRNRYQEILDAADLYT